MPQKAQAGGFRRPTVLQYPYAHLNAVPGKAVQQPDSLRTKHSWGRRVRALSWTSPVILIAAFLLLLVFAFKVLGGKVPSVLIYACGRTLGRFSGKHRPNGARARKPINAFAGTRGPHLRLPKGLARQAAPALNPECHLQYHTRFEDSGWKERHAFASRVPGRGGASHVV